MIGKAVRSFFENMESIGIKKWMIFLVIGFSVIIFFLFQQGDIITTTASSFAYFEGHFSDFYDYNTGAVGGSNYLPSTYIVFAIWNLPLKLTGCISGESASTLFSPGSFASKNFPFTCTGLSLFWAKLLPVMFYIASAYLLFKILETLGYKKKESLFTSVIWITTPIAFFSQFIFGQYDSFTMFFLLLGFYYYLKGDLFKFALFFGIGCTFKYFSLLLFIPLLFFIEKRFTHIIKYMAIFVAPLILVIAPYLNSPAFQSGVVGFGATSYITASSLPLGMLGIQIKAVIFIWVGLCLWTLMKQSEKSISFTRDVTFIAAFTFSIVFGLSFFHPQWVLIATPFWVLQYSTARQQRKYLVLDILLMLVFVGFSAIVFQQNVDQHLLSLGALSRYFQPPDSGMFTIQDFLPIKDSSIYFSLWSGFLLFSALLLYKYDAKGQEDTLPNVNMLLLRFFVGTALFIIPALICFVKVQLLPEALFSIMNQSVTPRTPLDAQNSYSQVFTSKGTEIESISFLVGTYNRTNDSILTIRVSDDESDRLLTEYTVNASNFQDNSWYTADIEDINVEIGKTYLIEFVSNPKGPNDFFTIYSTQTDLDPKRDFALWNGQVQNYDLAVRVSGN